MLQTPSFIFYISDTCNTKDLDTSALYFYTYKRIRIHSQMNKSHRSTEKNSSDTFRGGVNTAHFYNLRRPSQQFSYLKMPSQEGSVYAAGPSVCIWQTWMFFNFLFLPYSAMALRRAMGVAAAPWAYTVSPEIKNTRLLRPTKKSMLDMSNFWLGGCARSIFILNYILYKQ